MEDLRVLQTPDGKRFTEFMDALLQATVVDAGREADLIETCQQTNYPDGGVDASVRVVVRKAAAAPEALRTRTHWQYKASKGQLSPAVLRDEIKKSFAQKLTREGSRYCVAFPDEITPQCKQAWEGVLFKAAKKINPRAKAPRIFSGSQLAAWASNYPGVVLQFLRPRVGNFLTLDGWGTILTGGAGRFVAPRAWTGAQSRVREHADLGSPTSSGILVVRGGAGIGKSRLVYEALRGLESARHLVIYVDNEAGTDDVRHLLVQYKESGAVLVLERPYGAHLEMLQAALRDPAARARIRVVVIEDDGRGTHDRSASDLIIEPPSEEEVRAVLSENRPTADRELIAYAGRSCGRNVRLAFDLLAGFQAHASARGSVRRYTELRVPQQSWREALGLCALFRWVRVGGDCDELCQLAPLLQLADLRGVRRAMREVGRATGFLQRRGRRQTVEPPAIASVAFEWAWEEWVEHDPAAFFDSLPEDLRVRMLRAAARVAPRRVRRELSDINTGWLRSLTAERLVEQPDDVHRLCALVELDPDISLARLLEFTRRSNPDALGAALSAVTRSGRAVQQELRWSLEAVLAYEAHWRAVERPLRVMAAVSSEGSLRELWRQVMSAELSGTPAAFGERTALLREVAKDERLALLAIEGARAAYRSRGFRTVPSRLVMGGEQLPEPEWRAKAWSDLREGQKHALDVLGELARDANPATRMRALRVLLADVRRLLAVGAHELLRNIVEPLSLDLAELDQLVAGIGQFLTWDTKAANSPEALEYIAGVREWLAELERTEPLVALLRLLHGGARKSASDRECWEEALTQHAATLAGDALLLERALPFLLRAREYGVFELGQALGRLSPMVPGVATILERALLLQERGLFARAYIIGAGSVREHEVGQVINAALERAGAQRAHLVELLIGARSEEKLIEDILAAHERESDRASLAALAPYLAYRPLAPAQVARLLDAMVAFDEPVLVGAATDMAGSWLMEGENLYLLDDEEVCGRLWKLAKRTAELGGGQTYFWEQLVHALAQRHPEGAIAHLAHVLADGDARFAFEVPRVLGRIAGGHTRAVVDTIGGRLLARSELGWVSGMDEIVPALPASDWLDWVGRHGVEAARVIAHHLPRPEIVDGTPRVPELTAHVLEQYGDDSEVERRFASGAQMRSHSGDIEGQYLAEAEVARAFIGHPISAIHTWAVFETRGCETSAEYWREHTGEIGFE